MTTPEETRRQNAATKLLDTRVEAWWKGLPAEMTGSRLVDVPSIGIGVLDQGWPTPCAILRRREVEHNIRVMSAYCAGRRVSLAPHAKTSMAPQLLWRQIEAGAWGLTVANVNQLRVLASFGFQRFILANEVVDPSDARWLADQLNAHEELEVFVFVDSNEAVDILVEAQAGAAKPIRVLIEMGIDGARCGLRQVSDAVALGRDIAGHHCLVLAGVAGFEGVVGMTRAASSRARARNFGGFLAESFLALRKGGLTPSSDGLVTAGGSIYFDDVLSGWRERLGDEDDKVSFVLRSGCYVTQDSGTYRTESPLGEYGELAGAEPLRPAIEVVARVISTPEPEFCVVNAGKRDVSHDISSPTLLWHREPAARVPSGTECVGLNDQHGIFRGRQVARFAVGDKVGIGISHPCTTFDKWRAMPMVNDDLHLHELILTFM